MSVLFIQQTITQNPRSNNYRWNNTKHIVETDGDLTSSHGDHSQFVNIASLLLLRLEMLPFSNIVVSTGQVNFLDFLGGYVLLLLGYVLLLLGYTYKYYKD